MACQQLQ